MGSVPAEQRNIRPSKIQHVTTPEEAFPFVAGGSAAAFLVNAGALLVARNDVTIRPLAERAFRLGTCLASWVDNESKVLSEFVRAFMRKILDFNKYKQLTLPISS